MRFLLGIVPPLVTKERIEAVQKSCATNKVPYFTEPHITLKNPHDLTEDKKWLAKVMTTIGNYPRFDIKIDEVETFGDEVLFLSLEYSKELVDLHIELVSFLNPNIDTHKDQYEGAFYHPHITLGKTGSGGMSPDELALMRGRAEYELWNFPSFQVSSIRLYQKSEPEEPYQKLLDIPLKF